MGEFTIKEIHLVLPGDLTSINCATARKIPTGHARAATKSPPNRRSKTDLARQFRRSPGEKTIASASKIRTGRVALGQIKSVRRTRPVCHAGRRRELYIGGSKRVLNCAPQTAQAVVVFWDRFLPAIFICAP